MSTVGTAHSLWQFWDGRKDSQWSQALGPLESPVEHGATARSTCTMSRPNPATPTRPYSAPCPTCSACRATPARWPMPRRLRAPDRPGWARFAAYVDAVITGDMARARQFFSRDEEAGLKLFVGTAQCVSCHSGPLFTIASSTTPACPP